MRIVYMGNRKVGERIENFLIDVGEEIVWGTVDGERLPSDSELLALKPEIGISVYYPHIIPAHTIELFPKGIINLHPALLPLGRGVLPVLWAIAEHAPMGVTIHYIDKGIDSGDIIVQRRVEYNDNETCRELYNKCAEVGVNLFIASWNAIKNGCAARIPQLHHKATFHRVKDMVNPEQWFDKTVAEIQNEWRKPA